MKQTLYIMSGIPGSGKSYKARELAAQKNAVIVSSDAIRGKINGDEGVQGNGAEVFKTFYREISEAISDGKNVIADATNLFKRHRRKYREIADTCGANLVYICMDTPLGECLSRNKLRDRKVPEHRIREMYFAREAISTTEGGHVVHIP